jgi:two-component system, NarL family, nitrate/nitrite response regulator NarL
MIVSGGGNMEKADAPIRIMLVDDHRSVLWGLERLIESEKPRMQVVAKATKCAEAVELAAKVSPDVIVLDLDLAGENGSEIIQTLVDGRRTRVLILTGIRDVKLRQAAILLGACGLVDKEEPAETILKAIEKVHGGELWLDRATTGRVFVELSRPKGESASPEAPKIASLTPREREIVETLGAEPGTDTKTLAERLHMGEHTLRNHLSRIYDKLGVPNRLELYVYAQRHGISRSRIPS